MVIILDENDNSPLFQEVDFSQNIRESDSAGTIVLSLFAQDRDQGVNGIVSYRIVSGNVGGR